MQAKILLVDDIEDNLLAIEAILEPEGYTFVKANSGKNALKILLKEYDFALILMDVKMPNLNGFETAALIYEREKLRHIPIIFITAHSYGDENVFKGYSSGAVDYIYKPINPGLLRAKTSVFVELYKKTYALMAQEQKLIAINKSLENEVKERRLSEEKITALNHQLLESIDRLEAANKDLDRVTFMASHDLQEPLRKIIMFSDLLQSKNSQDLNEEGKTYISRIQKAANRMRLLIKDILTFSKISLEKESFSTCDMNMLVNEVLSEMEMSIKQANATVTVQNLPSIPVYPTLILPLFHNLISNSLKYSKQDVPPAIKIYSRISEAENMEKSLAPSVSSYCRIFVEDNGIGFEQKYSEQIFGMFQRLHYNVVEGTGIGLALCKKIVEEHGGFISAISRPNEGATFIISLPLSSTN
jgi:signal transduction histidine kinase